MKKSVAVILLSSLMVLFIFAASVSSAAGTEKAITIPLALRSAETLNKLGLFQGTEKGYELTRHATRAEAVTMVLRMVGEDEAASSLNTPVDFADIAESHWARANIGYAVAKGYIEGTSKTTFGAAEKITGQEFVKVLLAAMGHKGVTVENAYDRGVASALLVNNYTKHVVATNGYQLQRNDVVNICYSALLAKDAQGKILKDVLIAKGVISEEDFNSLLIDAREVDKNPQVRGFAWALNELMPKDENYMFSPLSIKLALAMTAVGADGETKAEMLETLGIDDLDEFNEFAEQIIGEYGKKEAIKLEIANSLWLNTDYYHGDVQFADDFAAVIAKYYDAASEEVDASDAVERINEWVFDKTEGKITELIDDSDFLAYIVNAIYFKGEWDVQFPSYATAEREFTGRDNQKKQIDFMNLTDTFDYYENKDLQMVRLPYQDGKTGMYLVLYEGRDIDLDKIVEEMERKRVKISLPKFKIESELQLKGLLSEMGIKTAFDKNKADFKKMFTAISENVFITDVIHKTFIDVDENGTEAAAATGVEMGLTSMPIEEPVVFTADRPFVYFIRDDVNGEILFMGEYAYAE